MNQDLSIIHLILNASFVVQVIMGVLLLASIISWAVIFAKWAFFKRSQAADSKFERVFWSGDTSLNDLFQDTLREDLSGSVSRIFAAGMKEFLKLRERKVDANNIIDGPRRAMRAAYQREIDVLETQLPFLASVGSVSPYVGLFGTVWGIMHAFTGLANMQQVTLATVAPGIAEALVATAIGLFAAIPAVLAYNRFSTTVDRAATRFETFIDEFTNILQRQATGEPQQR
ncbi:MAG: protein TolQ [Saezia sp.]